MPETTLPPYLALPSESDEAAFDALDAVRIWTDGSSKRGGESVKSEGGWAFIAEFRGQKVDRYGYSLETTNNEMELTAIEYALRFIRPSPQPLAFYVDSRYALGALTEWGESWERNDWRKRDGSPVKNVATILASLHLLRYHRQVRQVVFRHVPGHQNNFGGNDLADALAGNARTQKISNWTVADNFTGSKMAAEMIEDVARRTDPDGFNADPTPRNARRILEQTGQMEVNEQCSLCLGTGETPRATGYCPDCGGTGIRSVVSPSQRTQRGRN